MLTFKKNTLNSQGSLGKHNALALWPVVPHRKNVFDGLENSAIRIASGFAVVLACLLAMPASAAKPGDAEAIPHVDSFGKDGFRGFLATEKHRAFVIAPGGAWAWKGDAPTVDGAVEGAIQECQRGSEQPCVPYAVDDNVVFNATAWATLWGPYQSRAEAARAHTGKERGDRFFNLAIRNSAGKRMKLSDLRGKVTVVHFWGTWCPSCRHEMPQLQKLYQELGSASEVQFVLLQMRENFATAHEWAQQQNLTLPLYDSGAKKMSDATINLANGKSVPDRRIAVAFPTTYVLDKHGIVVFSHIGSIEGWSQYLPFLRDVAAKSGK